MNCSHRGQSAVAAGGTAVTLVMPSTGSGSRSSPVRRSTVPPGVPSRNGSRSHASELTAICRVGARKLFNTASKGNLANLFQLAGLGVFGELARQLAAEVEGKVCLVFPPVRGSPFVPAAGIVAEAQPVFEAMCEDTRDTVLRDRAVIDALSLRYDGPVFPRLTPLPPTKRDGINAATLAKPVRGTYSIRSDAVFDQESDG